SRVHPSFPTRRSSDLIELTAQASRRNVLTRGIDLNALVGERFRVGEVECEGVELCEPCSHLASLTHPGVLRGMVHRAGLNADIRSEEHTSELQSRGHL